MASNGGLDSWQAQVAAALAASSARISAMAWWRFGLIFALWALPGLSVAQSYSYHVLIDSDLRSTTGCEVLLANGERMTGAEWRMTAVVRGMPPRVVSQSLAACQGGNFVTAATQNDSYPVGLNNGLALGGGRFADVIEVSLPRDQMPGADPLVRVGFSTESDSGSIDALFTAAGTGGPPMVVGTPRSIPTLGFFGALLLALALAGVALRMLRRNRMLAQLLLIGAFISAGFAAWAANFIADGQVGDWAGISPIGTDAIGDSLPNLTATDIVGAFAAEENRKLHFRIDVVDAENRPPIAVADAYPILEDTTLSVATPGVLGNDSDPDGNPISAQMVSVPTRGTLTLDANGSFSYTPNANVNGTDSFTYNAFDGQATSLDPATAAITITPVNDAPVFTVGSNQSLLEDAGPQSVTSWATGIDDGDPEATQTVAFEFTGNSNTALFSAGPAVSPAGVLSYTPAANANGSATISLRLNDDGGSANGGVSQSAPQTFTITVTPVNDAPTFVGGANQAINEDAGPQVVAGWATAMEDGDPELMQALSFTATVVATTGSLAFSAAPSIDASTGNLGYTAIANSNGVATVEVRLLDDGSGATPNVNASAPQILTIAVQGINDAPSFTTGPNQVVNEDAGPQTVNPWATALDDGDPGIVQALTFVITNNSNGALFSAGPSVSSTGVLSFTPAADANGSATITLRIEDDGASTPPNVNAGAVQSFTINVIPVNDAPSFAAGPNQSVNEDAGAQTVNPWATAISPGPADEVGQTLVFAVASNSNAALFSAGPSVSPAGVLNYTLAANANGNATITLTLSDSGSSTPPNVNISPAQAFTITLGAVNDAPVNTLPAAQITGDSMPLVFSSINLNAISVADIDAASGVVQMSFATGAPANGTLTLANPGSVLTSLTGNGSELVTATGTLTALNTALNGPNGSLTYTPVAGTTATRALTVTSDDQGNTGLGGAQVDADTLFVSVDAPPVVVSVPATGATVANNAAVAVNFSEPVTVVAGITLSCGGPNLITGGNTGTGVTSLGLAYTAPLPAGSCTLLVPNTSVDDDDSIDPPQNPTTSYTATFTVDAPPALRSSSPAEDAVVSTAQTVNFTYDEPLSTLGTPITLNCGGPVAGAVSVSDATLTFTPTDPLPAGASCLATAVAAQIGDADAFDPPQNPISNSTIHFTVDAAPVFVSATPAAAAVVGAGQAVSFTFDENVANLGNAITLDCAGAVAGTISGAGTPTLVFTPTNPLPAGASCTATATASAIGDSDNVDPPQNPVADQTRSFAVDVAPTVLSTVPIAGATGVPLAGVITLNFSEPVDFALASFGYACNNSPVAFVAAAGSVPGSVTLTPIALLPVNADCVVVALASGISDSDSADPPDHSATDTTIAFRSLSDDAPGVSATTPVAGAYARPDVALRIEFSESVEVLPGALDLRCDGSSNLITGGDTGLAITEMSPVTGGLLPAGECRLTIKSDRVRDTDANDPPDQMTADALIDFSVTLPPVFLSQPALNSPELDAYAYPVEIDDHRSARPVSLSIELAPVGAVVDGSGRRFQIPEAAMTPPASHLAMNPGCLRTPNGQPPVNASPALRWRYITGVGMSPLVGPLLDRNSDGTIDSRDAPTILVHAFNPGDGIEGALGVPTFIDGATGRWLADLPDIPVKAGGNPAYADVNGDGRQDIIAFLLDMSVIAFQTDGTVLWTSNATSWPSPGGSPASIGVADFEGDGVPEILAGGTVLNANGSVRWQSQDPIPSGFDSPIYVDPRGNGDGLVVLADHVHSESGALLWTVPVLPDSGERVKHVAAADFDADGVVELLFVHKSIHQSSARTHYQLYRPDGTLIWHVTIENGLEEHSGNTPVIADFTGDGRLDFVTAGTTTLRLYDGDGRLVWSTPLDNLGSDSVPAAAFDFDGDGRMEVVVHDHQRLLFVDGRSGQVRYAFRHASRTSNEQPVIADIDGDGTAEVLVASDAYEESGLYAYGSNSAPWSRTLPLWNQFQFNITNGVGPPWTTGQTGLWWQQQRTFRVNQRLQPDPALMFDLVPHRLRLLESPPRLEFDVLNRGRANSSAYVARVESPGGVAIAELPGTAIASGANARLTLALDGYHSSPTDLRVRVSATDPLFECDTANNQSTGRYAKLRATAADGQFATQDWLINIDQVNAQPAIETESLPDATAGLDYSHLVSVADPDLGDAPRLAIIEGPPGLLLHPQSGELKWRPPVTAIGQHAVRVLVTDLAGATAERAYSLRVNANTSNQPPVFRSVPVTSVAHNVLYLYEILAEDPEGEPLTYSLLDALPGMLIYSPHRILWSPDTEYGSTRPVHLRVTDPQGAYADQQFTVTLLHNSAPEITSTPQRLSYPGFAYRYVVIAVDADHDPIGYSLAVAPRGMHIDSHSGQIDWTAGIDQVGSHAVLVWAADGKGGVASQSYTLTVRADNEPPSITTIPPVVAKVGREYRYDVDATDPEGVTLVYALRMAPPGMQIDAGSGLIRWTPTTVGSAAVTVRVDDGEDYVEQLWTITVSDAAEPLVATLSIDPVRVAPNVPVAAQVGESGAAGAVTRWLELDGVHLIPLDANGQANVSAPTVGRHTLRATVSDGYEITYVEGTFLVVDASDTTPPVVDLIAPADNAEITAPTPVRITVQDAQLVEWTLHFRESNSPDAPLTRLAVGTQNVTNEVVAQFDPTVLLNGQYTLYLQATDEGGNTVDDSVVLRVTGDMKIGNFSLTFEEVSIPVAGIPVTVSRTYDTRRRNEALDFGYGWTIDYRNVRVHESTKLGFSWQIREIRNGTITEYCNESNGDRVVTVTLPDGSVESFRAVVVPHCTLVAPSPFVRLAFEPIDGTDSLLQSDPGQLVLTTVAGSPGMMTLIDPDGGGAPIDPSVYELTLPEGLKYELDQNFGIRRVTDLVGNTLTYSNTGVVHSSGIGIDFERNAQGRIDALVLPDGNRIEYDYAASGDLLAARDVLNVATSFAYAYPRAPHYLTTITDGRNLPVVRNEYDDDGRLVASIDGNGQRIEFTHYIDARLERVKDRRGHTTTYVYDNEGRVLTETNALNETITRSYDADGNVLTEEDPLQRTRTMTYDLRGNTLTESNDLGETTTSTYDARNNLLTQEDALHRPVISNVYNNVSGALLTTTDALNQHTAFGYDFGVGAGTQTGELKSITDALGRQTVYGLDAAGRGWRVSETDAAGTTTRYTHDDMGRVRTETRPRTLADGSTVDEVTTTTYDEKGRVRRVDHPDGSFSTTEYNAIDKPERECDALSRCMVTTYTPRGEVERVTYADNTYEETTYDPNGNTLSQRDRGGRVTRMVYDAANRLTEAIYPDPGDPDGNDGDPLNNPRTRSEYDSAGQLRYSFDELSHRTEYRYDDAGRQTHVIDALGNTTVTAYDAAGQRESVTDAEERTTRFLYDAAGRLTVTIHPDQTPGDDADNPRSRIAYDAAGQKIAAADEMGRTTRYAYDALGRLERVVLPNPASGANPELVNGQSPAGSGTLTTRYVYDQRGNKTRQIDALERITRFEYDPMGRQTARQLPLGQRETMSYNAAGEQFAKLTFNNEAIAMAYDEVSRPRTITLPDRTRSFSYTASGQIRQIVDGSDTWTFAYDARDRLKRAEDAFGRAIDYDYDAAGNRTELKTCASVGATCTSRQVVQYAFDDLNRLREVVATLDGGVPQTSQYRYSDVGSRSGMTHPNGTVVDYTYDARNRLKTLVHKASAIASAATLLALSYTVDASGLRTQIAEERPGDATTPIYNRVTDYAYDAVQRLTREQVSGNHGNPDRVHAWTYDAVGNRLTQIATVGAAPSATTSTTTYDYDANDRLLTEATEGAPSGATTTTHTYDAAGNLTVTREGATTVAQYTWDAEGRLAAAILGNGSTQKTTAYRYDPNGIRRSQQVTEPGGAVTSTEYLVDPNQAYAQVLEEWTATAAAGPLPDEALATTYVYGDDLISQTKLALAGPSVTSVYHYDGLGTTRALSAYTVDAAGVPQPGHGEITDRYAYTAFGESDPAGTSGDTSGSSDNNYRYTGEQLDPNLGFYYLRARYMDPGLGRFLGMDPFQGSSYDPASLHKYAYANANPATYFDPSGRLGIISVFGVNINIGSSIAFLGTRAGLTATAKFGLELAFEYSTGIPILTSPRGMIQAVRSLKNIVGELASGAIRRMRAGRSFERAVEEMWDLTKNTTCFKKGVPDVPPGCFIPDFLAKGGRFIEVKTSMGAVRKAQFQEFIQIARNTNQPLIMIFLRKPAPADIERLQRWAVEIVGESDDLLLNIIHVLD